MIVFGCEVILSDKSTGSFYTPHNLVKFMTDYVQGRTDVNRILEPSAGDGRFVEYLKLFHTPIHLVENDPNKAYELMNRQFENTEVTCQDFISFSLEHTTKYDLIIGNPPYISKKKLSEEQRIAAIELVKSFNLPEDLFQNLWVLFILGSLKLLSENGAIFFILPFEFLQVQYAEKLRGFLEEKFNTIEITTFEKRVFSEIEQDICLVYLTNEPIDKPYVKYTTLKNVEEPLIIFNSIIMKNKPIKKWSNCILDDDETEMLKRISAKYPQIRSFGDISPGIVTGANSFFIIDRTQAEQIQMEQAYLRILSKSNHISSKLLFSINDFNDLVDHGKKVYLLNLTGIDEETFSERLKEHLDQGREDKLHERYKCKQRNRWYDVPIVKNGDLCFFKRYHLFPRIIINESGVHTTDISYNIRIKDEFDKYSFAFCFYNSLTLVLCEYNGRFYGGGVGELVPSEFKDLHIPYRQVEKRHILFIDQLMRDNRNILEVIDYVDDIVLTISPDEKALLQDIRNRFITRRLTNNS
jgi:adenine-specific DNA-methyltransferase